LWTDWPHSNFEDCRIEDCSNQWVTGIREPAMLTGMTERDWALVLKLFDAAQSSRGEPGQGDLKFLEAVHYFTVHSITWRALPAEYGKWNSVWKRVLAPQPIWRVRGGLSGARGVQPNGEADTILRQHNCPRTHLGRRRKRGQHRQAFGRSRGGFSTKIQLKTDLDGHPLDFHLTSGQASDSTEFETSLNIGPDIHPRIAMTDKGYDRQANRAAARARGTTPVIPRRENSKQRGRFFPKLLYKLRARIEQTIGKLKRFKRVAMRCDKTDTSYSAFVSFACGLILIKSVHNA
jgi:transposase